MTEKQLKLMIELAKALRAVYGNEMPDLEAAIAEVEAEAEATHAP